MRGNNLRRDLSAIFKYLSVGIYLLSVSQTNFDKFFDKFYAPFLELQPNGNTREGLPETGNIREARQILILDSETEPRFAAVHIAICLFIAMNLLNEAFRLIMQQLHPDDQQLPREDVLAAFMPQQQPVDVSGGLNQFVTQIKELITNPELDTQKITESIEQILWGDGQTRGLLIGTDNIELVAQSLTTPQETPEGVISIADQEKIDNFIKQYSDETTQSIIGKILHFLAKITAGSFNMEDLELVKNIRDLIEITKPLRPNGSIEPIDKETRLEMGMARSSRD